MKALLLLLVVPVLAAAQPLPRTLAETGFGEPDAIAFSPQYPLWSDGTKKRRWLYLPPGAAIDASQPDAWDFPPGTRLWKEFSYERPVETRFIERLADGTWRFAAYVWNAQGTQATLAPESGVVVAAPGAPGGRYAVPGRNDCLACHEGAAVPVLGVSALQLSPDRDPLAPHGEPRKPEQLDLAGLVAAGKLTNLPPALLQQAPRIAAKNATARAALGYLHANCGHCHNDDGPLAGVELALSQRASAAAQSAVRTMVTLAARRDDALKRVRSTNPNTRMPPLGVALHDVEGLALVERWIRTDLQPTEEKRP